MFDVNQQVRLDKPTFHPDHQVGAACEHKRLARFTVHEDSGLFASTGSLVFHRRIRLGFIQGAKIYIVEYYRFS